MRNHAGRLQIVQPSLNALAVRTNEPGPLAGVAAPDPTPSPAPSRHQLLDRAGEPARPPRVPQTKQVALHRIHPRLDPVVSRRRAPAGAPRAPATRTPPAAPARWKRRPPRPIPMTGRPARGLLACGFQRHRQRPKTPAITRARWARADARGTAGGASDSRELGSAGARSHSSMRGWDPFAVRLQLAQAYLCAPRGAIWRQSRRRKTGLPPGLLRSGADAAGGPRHRGQVAAERLMANCTRAAARGQTPGTVVPCKTQRGIDAPRRNRGSQTRAPALPTPTTAPSRSSAAQRTSTAGSVTRSMPTFRSLPAGGIRPRPLPPGRNTALWGPQPPGLERRARASYLFPTCSLVPFGTSA